MDPSRGPGRRKPWRWRLACLVGLVLSALWLPASAPAKPPPSFNEAALDALIEDEMTAERIPGLAVALVWRDGHQLTKGYGSARDGSPVIAETQFLVGSVSKSFTALAVMQLVDAGRIDVDQPVQHYLPDFQLADAGAARSITVRQLLNHTSGLGDAGFPAMKLPQPQDFAERIISMRSARSVDPPGRAFNYYDVNYQVLARLVEVVSGQSFSDYLQERVLGPLGMEDSFSALTSAEARERAQALARGHVLVFDFPVGSDEEEGFFGGSGGIVTTAADISRYLSMQLDSGRYPGGRLLSEDALALMHTPPPEPNTSYGMGWVAATENGMAVLEHNGILSTFYAEVILVPKKGFALALLSNIHSLSQDVFGFPRLRRALVGLLAEGETQASGLSVLTFELLVAVIAAVTVGLALLSLARFEKWRKKSRQRSPWRNLFGVVALLIPGALALAMPSLTLAASGRAFGFATFARGTMTLMLWLLVWGAVNAANAALRVAVLADRLRKGRGTAL